MKREIEEKGVVPHSQAGFRKGRGTIDNMYILDHLEKSELKKKERRMCADFRTAFDKVGTEKMFEYMREREREVYARTKSKVKVGEKEGEWFETWRKKRLEMALIQISVPARENYRVIKGF
jgi:hypothetical protein